MIQLVFFIFPGIEIFCLGKTLSRCDQPRLIVSMAVTRAQSKARLDRYPVLYLTLANGASRLVSSEQTVARLVGTSAPLPLRYHAHKYIMCAPGRIRTDTLQDLNLPPLPLGYGSLGYSKGQPFFKLIFLLVSATFRSRRSNLSRRAVNFLI